MAMTKVQSRAGGYVAEMDDAERASRDAITALQTRRLAWSLAHAYGNVAHYKKAFDKAGVHPSDFKQLSDLSKFPFTVKTICATITRSHGSPCRAKSWFAFTPRQAPPASRSWSATPRPISMCGRR